MPYFATVGREILGLFFLAAGIPKFMGTPPQGLIDKLTAFGLPMADNLYWVAAGFEVVAGLALVLGLFVPLFAFLAAGFCVVTGVVVHDFWNMTDEAMKQANQIGFMKNVAIAGGLLAFVSWGSGPLALGRRHE